MPSLHCVAHGICAHAARVSDSNDSHRPQQEGNPMPTQYMGNVVQLLAHHLGVSTREIALSHDLYRDWGLTPLSFVIVLLDLERSVALELPCEQFSGVRTVADLVRQFQALVQADDRRSNLVVLRSARSSRSARNERRLRRELHHLRWLEQNQQRRALGVSRPSAAPRALAARHSASR
jgi:acyl carrier protein